MHFLKNIFKNMKQISQWLKTFYWKIILYLPFQYYVYIAQSEKKNIYICNIYKFIFILNISKYPII